VKGALLLVCGVVTLALSGWVAARPRASATPAAQSGLVLVSTERPGAKVPYAADPPRDDSAARATACALASLTPLERAALASALDELAKRLEARANPLDMDLDDAPPEAEIESAARYLLPAFTAARSLTSGVWLSEDGFAARAVRRCPDGASCVRLYGDDATTPEQRRARFLAWPLASAAILRARDGASAERAANGARASLVRTDTRIALIVSGRDLRAGSVDWAELRESAQRVLRSSRESAGPGTRALAMLAEPPAHGDLAPFLALADDEVLVVPRMGAIAEPGMLADEVRSRFAPFEEREGLIWEQRPAAITE